MAKDAPVAVSYVGPFIFDDLFTAVTAMIYYTQFFGNIYIYIIHFYSFVLLLLLSQKEGAYLWREVSQGFSSFLLSGTLKLTQLITDPEVMGLAIHSVTSVIWGI